MQLPETSQTCKRCDIEILEGHAYELADDRWHINCFKCFKCEKSLGCNSNFLVLGNGSLVCSQCSYSCKQCNKKIDDLAILTGDQAYCSSCFKCRVCKSKIEDLRYARTSKGLFCMACHEGLIEKKRKHDMKRRQMAQLSSSSRPSPQDELDAPFSESYSQKNVSSHSIKQLPLLQPELSALGSPDDRSFGTALSTTTTQVSAPFSEESAQIEEINDSDDELKIRKMREKLDRRFRKSSAQADGAILELIDSFSAPNTPSTIYNPADEHSLTSKDDGYFAAADSNREGGGSNRSAGSALSRGEPNQNKDARGAREVTREVSRDSASVNSASTPASASNSTRRLEHTSPHRNLLLLSPNQFHDNDFHVAGGPISHTHSTEEVHRPRSSASSPMAKVNRQARVVETDVTTAEIPVDFVETPQSRDWDRQRADERQDVSTPKKVPAASKVTSPPPKMALPEVPSTPTQPFMDEDAPPAGLGLDVDLRHPNSANWAQKSYRRTPTVTNLEDSTQENPPSRKQSVRSKISLKHKRSISGGQNNLSGKFGLFKGKDDERGHSRTASEGSIAGTAYVTPPLPLSSPMRSTYRDHARSTSDTHFKEMPADFEMRSIRIELGQLDMRRQSLLAENSKLTAEKNRLLESLRAVQKKHASEQQQHEALMLQVHHLGNERARLMEENSRLKGAGQNPGNPGSNSGSGSQGTLNSGPGVNAAGNGAASSPPNLSAPNPNRTSIHENDLYDPNAGLDSVAEEGSEARATRLKFWRRPKVTIGATGQAILAPQSKMSLSSSSQQLSVAPEESGARKALNFMSKSRSTYVLDQMDSDGSLFSATLQTRADYENEPVPLIISRCLAEVESRGFDMEGIYRLSGGNSAITAIENAFASVTAAPDRKQSPRLQEVLSGDINAVTSALKRYLRKIPEPIIPFAVYDNFIRIGQAKQFSQDPAKIDELCADFSARIVERLPQANKTALYMIGKHLDQVNFYSNVNRMNFKNLSVVFAPTIARDASGEREMVDMGARNEATELLFRNFRKIFRGFPN